MTSLAAAFNTWVAKKANNFITQGMQQNVYMFIMLAYIQVDCMHIEISYLSQISATQVP